MNNIFLLSRHWLSDLGCIYQEPKVELDALRDIWAYKQQLGFFWIKLYGAPFSKAALSFFKWFCESKICSAVTASWNSPVKLASEATGVATRLLMRDDAEFAVESMSVIESCRLRGSVSSVECTIANTNLSRCVSVVDRMLFGLKINSGNDTFTAEGFLVSPRRWGMYQMALR